MPGDRIIENRTAINSAPNILAVHAGRQHLTLSRGATAVNPLDFSIGVLGFMVLLTGTVTIIKGRDRDRRVVTVFWRMSLLVGLTLSVIPAGFHGLPWALVFTFVFLILCGPALLDLAFSFPDMGDIRRVQRLFWLPALILIGFYPLCWWSSVPLFSSLQSASDALLAGYILAACARIGWVLRQPLSPLQQAQLRFLALGVIGGFAPVVGLNLLPYVLIGRDLVPVQLSILALGLLPLSVGAGIVHAEFLGITSLLHRRSLHIIVGLIVLAGVAFSVGWLTTGGARQWGWPAPATAALTGMLTALGFLIIRPTLTGWAERLVLHDVYDTGDTLCHVGLDIAQGPPSAVGALAVTRLSNVLDLTDALLLTPTNQWSYAHPRTADPIAVQEAVIQRALHLFVAPPHEAFVERAGGQPILFLPVWCGPDLQAVLCLGPKRSEDRYTEQDQALLDILVRHLGLVFSNQCLYAQLEAQTVIQPGLLPLPDEHAGTSGHILIGPPLSARELETLRYLAEGLCNKEIAERMFVVEKTVHKHVAAILDKLDAHNRTEAVTIARRTRLLPLE